MLPARRLLPFLPAIVFLCPLQAAFAAEFFGPTPYLSAADTPPGFSDTAMVIEDCEDGLLDPRLSLPLGGSIIGPGGLTDSVDADDGVIDGSGSNGRSLFRNSTSISIQFNPPLPTSAGLVWTDGGAGTSATFEAFDASGASLGTHGPFTLGDNSNSGGTSEDRFLGVRDAGGIARIQISHTTGGLEIDHVQYNSGVETAIFSTLEDGDLGLMLPTPDGNLPGPAQRAFALPAGSRPHGLAFLGGDSVLFADFPLPRLLRSSLAAPDTVDAIALDGRSNGNGSLAVDPNGRYALSIGESNDAQPLGEAVVVDFSVDPPQVSAIAGGLRVLSFVTAAIDFAPDRRAFVCHTQGVSVLSPPYTQVDFTMPFPATVLSPSMCRLSRDGSRLFVTRVLSESVATVNAVRTTTAPYSAGSVFTEMPTPPDVQGLGPMAVSPDGQALIVGQQFLFPPAFLGTRARAFLLRAPFDGQTEYQEIALPAELTGANCTDAGAPEQCPGFEHIEVSADGSLAILTGNSGSTTAGAADAVPTVFLRNPFDDATRTAVGVQLGSSLAAPGRGAGGVRFLPASIFADGLE